MITLDLSEKKLSQLNQQHVSKTKDLEKAMHSQGIDPGEPKRDAHHVQYPKATFRKTGKPARGITAVDDGKGKLTSSTGGNTVRDAVLKSGRVDKRPAAKAERAKEAAENKAAKKKNRDPFTREHTEWWVEMWRLDEGRDAKARAQRKFDRENTAIVKVPGSERTQKETSGIARKSGPGVRVPETETKKPEAASTPVATPTPAAKPKKKPVTKAPAAAQPKSKYASADQIRDRKFQDYKADRKDRQKRQAQADKYKVAKEKKQNRDASNKKGRPEPKKHTVCLIKAGTSKTLQLPIKRNQNLSEHM